MKAIKPFLIFLVFVLIAGAIFSLLMPTKQKIESSVTINASVAVVYEQISRLENFNRWSVWTNEDSSAVYTLKGNDGTVGATSSWTGHPELSGEGKMEITGWNPAKKYRIPSGLKNPKKQQPILFSL